MDIVGANQAVCVFGALPRTLRLRDAIERSLCLNPRTREAWANVKIQTSAVGVARAAFLPTLSANMQSTRNNETNHVIGSPQYDSNYLTNLRIASVSLSWVLYDFGSHAAALRNEANLLAAAQASQHEALEAVFAKVAKDYYAAQAAWGALTAAREIEQAAHSSVEVATALFNAGRTALSDQLQAETIYADSIVSRVKSEEEWQVAKGTLAVDMDLSPDIELSLPDVGDGVVPTREFVDSVAELIEEAQRTHPSIAAARARVAAARAKAEQTRADGLPRLNLVAQYSYNNQPTSLQLGYPVFPATHSAWYLGLQVTIPLFEGFTRTYLTHQAEAQTDLQAALLDETRQQVGLDVWTSYQALQSATSNLGNSATLFSLAQRSYEAAKRRYQMGVGNIQELLNTQSSLASAKLRRIQALTDWRSGRLQLAAKLGKLGMWSLDDVK
ncbi:Fis family transcriptional regulator [Burkholderia lata]|uniref:Protein CyaE n=2 Tax=Burkholderia lata (strain ATCC 17760 / DSM 23089 / LMG 22485 / NCIMB 9086 / R18194 / 383) TaxID=482957 RepID=A0A6P2NTC4_BURL3|nr:Fis family transcriptional regulator [Burkholderia lata]